MDPTKKKNAALISRRRNGLFKKANELAVLCDAEVGLITISDDGVIHEFASSNMQSIIARVKEGLKSMEGSNSENQEADEPMPEVVAVEKPQSKQNFVGKDFACMKLKDFVLLEEQLNKGLLCIRERKIQLLMDEVMLSRMQEQHVLQQNHNLQRQVEELQGFGQPVYSPTPLSVYFPETEPGANRASLPSTNSLGTERASSLPSTNSLGTERASSLPSTSFAAPETTHSGLDLNLPLCPSKPL